MIRRPRAVLSAIVFSLALRAIPGAAAPPPAPPKPKLAVVISVDGLGWARLEGYRPLYTAGLKRLLDEGWNERGARYQHLNTETGPGHASLGTGAPPRVTGIVLNSWFEYTPDGALQNVYCTDQKDAVTGRKIAGPGNLRVPTLGDRLVEAVKGARVVSVSAKDRGAIFLAGKDPAHAVYWYDGETGRFQTSAAYRPPAAAGAIVKKFNETRAGGNLPARFGLVWQKLPEPAPAPGAKPYPTAVPLNVIARYQFPSHGLGFGHDISTYGRVPAGAPYGYFGGIYRSPLIDELTADLVLAFLNDTGYELGHGDVPDLLAISFSGHDPVAHDYGDESEESRDALRRLDVQIGRVLDALDANYPKGTVLVALSADHGFPVMPEVAKALDKTATGGRLETGRETLHNDRERLNRLLADALCLDRSAKVVGGMDGWNLFYSRAAFPYKTVAGACGRAGAPVTAADVDRVLPGVIKHFWDEEVEEVLLVSAQAAWPDTPARTFVRNDFDRERSGDAFVIPRFGVMNSYNPGRGAMHGTLYEYDIHVPLVFWGAGVRAGASDTATTPYDLAPTVGRWLGVTLPEATGRALPLPR
ncbi:MAG: alkaline phosphatase family protein [Thermoanaerobaculia bacterium]|nr:alkaline phosphatase family protein [Thermoanaerobaculia bacterium]